MSIEQIDAELITRYIASCSTFRAKATVYDALSTMRGFGNYPDTGAGVNRHLSNRNGPDGIGSGGLVTAPATTLRLSLCA